MNNWRLLLTRSAPDCYEQAQALKMRGIECQCLPLIEIIPSPTTKEQHQQLINLRQYTGLIVISKPAADLFLQKLKPIYSTFQLDQQMWFTVGQATATILKKVGITPYTAIEQDNSEALWQLPDFQHLLAKPNQHILIVKGVGGRQWLLQKLQARNIATHTLELYKRQLPNYTQEQLIQKIIAHNINAIVVSSGQGLYNLYNLAQSYWQHLLNMIFFVPSARVAKQAKELGAKKIIDCKGASLQSLLSALTCAYMTS